MRASALLTLSLAALALQGCIARAAVGAAVGAVTLPVKVVSKGVDVATTSQSESDENRGRALRKREEQLGRLEREYDKQAERCDDGDDDACDQARAIQREMRALLPGSR